MTNVELSEQVEVCRSKPTARSQPNQTTYYMQKENVAQDKTGNNQKKAKEDISLTIILYREEKGFGESQLTTGG